MPSSACVASPTPRSRSPSSARTRAAPSRSPSRAKRSRPSPSRARWWSQVTPGSACRSSRSARSMTLCARWQRSTSRNPTSSAWCSTCATTPAARWRRLGPDTGIKLTTARYYPPSGKSIQAKGIVPDVMIDESEEGNIFAALRMREADLDKHLGSGQGEEKKDEAREKARESALKRMEEEAKKPAAERKAPEFGSDKDFQLVQALNQLKGRPVLVSKTLTERKDEKKEN